MKYIRVGVGELCIVKLNSGEHLPSTLVKLAEELRALLLVFHGLGGFKYAKIGFFREQGGYSVVEVRASSESVLEVASLTGSVLWTGEKYHVHAHVALGGLGTADIATITYAGHLIEAVVDPLLELFVLVYPETPTGVLREVLPHRFS